MINLEILVNNKPFDYQDRNDFGLLFKKSLSSSITNRADIVSFTTNFPATNNNLSILDLNLSLDNYWKFNKDANYAIEILVNSVSLIKGILIVQLYSKDIIQGFIIGSGISQASTIQNKSIKDINLPTTLFLGGETIINRYNDFKNYQDTFGNSYQHSQDNATCFPLISFGTYFISNRVARRHDIDNTDQQALINTDELLTSEVPALKYNDIPFSVYYSRIFKQIFADIGYIVQGSQITSEDMVNQVVPCVGSDELIYNYNTIGGFNLTCNSLTLNPQSLTQINPFGRTWFSNTAFGGGVIPIQHQTYFTVQDNNFRNNFDLSLNYGLTFQYPTSNYNTNTGSEPYWVCPTDGEYEQTFSVGSYQQETPSAIGALPNNQNTLAAYALVRVNEEDVEQVQGQFQTFTTTTASTYYTLNAGVYDVGATILPPTPNGLGVDSTLRKIYPTLGFDNSIFIFNLIDIGVTNPSPFYPSFTGSFKANKGDRFKLIFINGATQQLGDTHNNKQRISINSGFNLNIRCVNADIYPQNYDGIELNASINLPDISQTDFVKDAITRYNLYFVVDETNKTITFETQGKFYPPQNPYPLKGKFIEASQKEMPERYLFNFGYDSDDYLTATDIDQDFTKRSEMRNTTTEENISTIWSKTDMQRYGIVNKLNTSLADYQSTDLTKWLNSGKTIEVPQISDKIRYNSLQSTLYDGSGNIIEPFEDQDFNYKPRLLRMNGYYLFDTTNPTNMPIHSWNELGATIKDKDIIIRQPNITSCDNTNMDQTYLYDTYYRELITEWQATEIVKFSTYLDYLDFKELKINRLIEIEGNIYRIIEFQPFSPINPRPIQITLQKVL